MTSVHAQAFQGRGTGRSHSGTRGGLPLAAVLAAVAAAGLVAGCSSGSSTASAAGGGGGTQAKNAAGVTISTRAVTGVGTVLTDQSGKTLYTPLQEASGVIKCTGSCLGFWFPVTVGNGAAPRATTTLPGTLSSIQRPDGSRQLTYNGKPLYTFRLDSAPGQVRGNDFTDSFGGQSFSWHAATASGTAPAPAQPSSGPSGSNYGSGAGGY
ncbi:MAG: COG4315 family predicted lipoprotein [Trebonia sp.]